MFGQGTCSKVGELKLKNQLYFIIYNYAYCVSISVHVEKFNERNL